MKRGIKTVLEVSRLVKHTVTSPSAAVLANQDKTYMS